jgi:hypothetical protein
MEDAPWGRSPRLTGIREQLKRSIWLIDSVKRTACQGDSESSFRMLILAVYSALAIAEIMLESAFQRELLGLNRDEFEEKYLEGLPYYLLVEALRIHDFHRFGLAPTSGVFYHGPVTLGGKKGVAAISMPLDGSTGKTIIKTGDAKVKEQRCLTQNGVTFLDDGTGKYLRLGEILIPYVTAIEKVIAEYETVLLPSA